MTTQTEPREIEVEVLEYEEERGVVAITINAESSTDLAEIKQEVITVVGGDSSEMVEAIRQGLQAAYNHAQTIGDTEAMHRANRIWEAVESLQKTGELMEALAVGMTQAGRFASQRYASLAKDIEFMNEENPIVNALMTNVWQDAEEEAFFSAEEIRRETECLIEERSYDDAKDTVIGEVTYNLQHNFKVDYLIARDVAVYLVTGQGAANIHNDHLLIEIGQLFEELYV